MDINMQPVDLALSYASRGWPVFPCRAKEEIDDRTGKVLSPKTPYTSNGLRGASLNERIIKEWWRRTPDAMVGVPTGRSPNVWVLDLDKKPGVGDGHDWLADQEAIHGPLPETARARTMGGGTHIFFNHVEGIRNRGGLGVAVDVRGDGGYIIAPGSQAADGRSYEWLADVTPADAPQWLLDLVLPKAAPYHPTDYHYAPGQNTAYVEAAIDAELSELARHAPGGRGEKLNRTAFTLGTLVGAGALDRGHAERELYQAAGACGLLTTDGEREVRAKIRRGLDAGIKQPRRIPEPEYQQDNTRLVDITKMLERAREKASGAGAFNSSAENPAEVLKEDRPPRGSTQPESSNTQDDSTTEVLEPATEAKHFYATPFEWKDPKLLPRREFTYGTHYIRKFVSVTVSPGGLGKTSNSIVEALSMVTGRDLVGIKPPKPLKVWLFNAEDPRDEMDRRIMAACLHYNIKPEDFAGRLFLDTGREQDLIVMEEDKKTGAKVNRPVVEAVVEEILAHGIDVMIVDPFVSTHRVNENDNGAIDKVAKLWAQIADYTNCAVDVVHHLRKLADREATVEDSRGAVSLIGAARSVRVLNRMSEEQATKANVGKDDRFSFFHIHQGKANLTRMDNSQYWRKLVSVGLGNGEGLTKPQDHAGVVTEWKYPSKEEIADAVPADVKSTAIALIGARTCRRSDQAGDWAGHVLAEVMGVSIDAGRAMSPEKKHIKSIIETWVDEGALVVERVPDLKKGGKPIEYLRPAA